MIYWMISQKMTKKMILMMILFLMFTVVFEPKKNFLDGARDSLTFSEKCPQNVIESVKCTND